MLYHEAGYNTVSCFTSCFHTGPLAQSAERGANNAKVMSSILIRTTILSFFFYNKYIPKTYNIISCQIKYRISVKNVGIYIVIRSMFSMRCTYPTNLPANRLLKMGIEYISAYQRGKELGSLGVVLGDK